MRKFQHKYAYQKEGETIESDNWIIQNLNSALGTWNERMTEIWTLITTAPEDFRGGSMWYVVLSINTALRASAYSIHITTAFFQIAQESAAIPSKAKSYHVQTS